MKIEKKHYIWGAIIIAIVLIYIYRNNLSSALYPIRQFRVGAGGVGGGAGGGSGVGGGGHAGGSGFGGGGHEGSISIPRPINPRPINHGQVTKQQTAEGDTLPATPKPKLKKCCDTDTSNSCSKNCKWSLANSGPCISGQTQC